MPAAPATDATDAAPRWRDPWRAWWLLSPLLAAGSVLNVFNVARGADLAWLFVMPAVVYLVVPLADALLGPDTRNPPESAVPALEADPWYRAVVAAYVPLQYIGTALGCWVAATVPLGVAGWVGLVLTVGGLNGVAINNAHELGHKRPRWERWLARVALVPSAYGHFHVEHNRGHHRRVATPEDPASARLGESFWAFLPRTMVGSLRSAWRLEADRLRARGQPVLGRDNALLQDWALTAVVWGALVAAFGPWAALFLPVQAFYAASLLEVVNYIEHYGLRRATGADGRPEPCTPAHSWNSSHLASNLLLCQLQRHSDHHAHPGRRFQALRHFDESPQLPSGYAGLVPLAYCTPLWFAVMDRRVLAHYGGDITRANLHPPRRAALLARHGAR
jgi:alkane 1-monooxygenase